MTTYFVLFATPSFCNYSFNANESFYYILLYYLILDNFVFPLERGYIFFSKSPMNLKAFFSLIKLKNKVILF